MIEPMLILQVLVWLAVFGLFLASGQASVFHPATMYLGFHGVVFVIRPILVYTLQFDSIWLYMGYHPDETDFIRALGVSSVALVSFVGASLFFGRAPVRFTPGPPPLLTPMQRRTLLYTTVILLPYMAASIVAGQKADSGERAANGVYIQTHSTGYLNDAQFMLAPLLCAWLLATRFHWLNLPTILLYVAYRSWNGWSRWTIVLFFLMIVLAYCWQRRRRWLPLGALGLAIPVLMLFNVLGHNRDVLKDFFTGQQNESAIVDIHEGMSPVEKRNLRYDTQDFANFDYLCFFASVYARNPDAYTYGTQYLQLLTEPIPRILWKGKPVGSPVPGKIDIGNYGHILGLTLSLPGDGFVSGGWIGVVVLMSLGGLIMGKCHRWFWKHLDEPMAVLFYVSGLAMLPQWFRDGGISIYKFLMWTWLPFLVWRAVIWCLNGRLVPGRTVVLRAGDRLRLVQSKRGTPEVN
jgi:hypothetical protein